MSDRLDAFRALLAMADPPELAGKRGRRYIFAGCPKRREALKVELERAGSNVRIFEARGEDGQIVSVRRRPGLRLLRRPA